MAQREFRAHPMLLWDVITRQAGTLSKAALEALQNSADAGASKCEITLDNDKLVISDDGKGFTMPEIEDFFEEFGHPHEEGDAQFGRYRMGRGQLFSFGRNTWLTNEFRMDVDLKPQKGALSRTGRIPYEFDTVPSGSERPGCHVTVDLYDKLSPSELDDARREVEKFVKYSPIPVILNGKRVSRSVTEEKWDAETPEGYLKYKEAGELAVYNKGVLVCTFPAYRFGCGGVVVSKKTLDVNFARNSIDSKCPVWKKLQARIHADAGNAVKRKPRLDVNERQAVAHRLLSGATSLVDCADLQLIECVNGNKLSPAKLVERLRKTRQVASAPLADRTATSVHEAKLAVVVSQGTLDMFESSDAREFMTKLHAASRGLGRLDYKAARFADAFDPAKTRFLGREDLVALVPDGMHDLDTRKLTGAEKRNLDVLTTGMYEIMSVFGAVSRMNANPSYAARALDACSVPQTVVERLVPRVRSSGRREIRVGTSDVALAWTDGTDNVWFERRMLKLVEEGIAGYQRLMYIGLHEMVHDAPNTGTHVHDEDFHSLCHDIAAYTTVVGKAVERMLDRSVKLLRLEDRRPSGKVRAAEDRVDYLLRKGHVTRPEEVEPEEDRLAALPARP